MCFNCGKFRHTEVDCPTNDNKMKDKEACETNVALGSSDDPSRFIESKHIYCICISV